MKKSDRVERHPAAAVDRGRRRARRPAAKAIRTGAKSIRNCGTPKSNSAWKVLSPIRKPPISAGTRTRVDEVGDRRPRRRSSDRARARRACASPSSVAWPTNAERGAADHHQVGRAPERHVLAEDPVPEVVEREAEQGEGAGREQPDAAERRVPVLAEPDGGRARACPRAARSRRSRRRRRRTGRRGSGSARGSRTGPRRGRRRCGGRCPSTCRSAATISETAVIAEGSAAQPGRPVSARGALGGGAEEADPARAVRPAERDRGPASSGRRRRVARIGLPDGGAAGRSGFGRGEGQHLVHRSGSLPGSIVDNPYSEQRYIKRWRIAVDPASCDGPHGRAGIGGHIGSSVQGAG